MSICLTHRHCCLIALRAQIALIFSAGMTPERLANIRVSHSGKVLQNSDTFIVPSSTLRLCSPGPTYKTELSQDVLVQAIERQTHIDLSLPEFYSELISTHIQTSPKEDNQLLFAWPPELIQKTVARTVKRLGFEFGARLTINRLQKHIERKLSALAWNDIAGV